MFDIPTDKFLQAYGDFLVQAWGRPPLKNRFTEDPETVLKEFGLDPEGATVIVETPGPPSPNMTPDGAAKLWNEGKKAGRIRFIFPREPLADLEKGVLAQQLEAITRGMESVVADDSCCCCTMCCCCDASADAASVAAAT